MASRSEKSKRPTWKRHSCCATNPVLYKLECILGTLREARVAAWGAAVRRRWSPRTENMCACPCTCLLFAFCAWARHTHTSVVCLFSHIRVCTAGQIHTPGRTPRGWAHPNTAGPALGFSRPAVTEKLRQTTIYWVVFRSMSVVTTPALISINTH